VSGQQRNLEGATRDILQVDKSVSEWGIINTKYGNKYSPMCAALLPIIAQCIWWGGGAVCVVCGRLGTMRGGSVVGQTVQPVQGWKNER